jgi:hypothetical protein
MNTFFRTLFVTLLILLTGCVKVRDKQPDAVPGTTNAAPPAQVSAETASMKFLISETLDYGDVVVGSHRTRTYEIINDGPRDASAVSVSALNAPFSITANTCTGVLATNASCTIDVTFAPTAPGLVQVSVSMTYNDGKKEQSASVSLQGTGISVGSLAVTPGNTHDFGNIIIGNTSTAQFSLTNQGQADVTGLSFSTLLASFQITQNNCGTSLTATQSCQFEVTFNPSAAQVFHDSVTIQYDNGTATVGSSLDLDGKGLTPAALSFSDAPTHSFGSLTVGQTATKQITLSNSGQSDASGLSFSALAAPFQITQNLCTATLGAGQSCLIDILFTAQLGNKSETLTASYNDGVAAQSASQGFSGIGVAAVEIPPSPSPSPTPVTHLMFVTAFSGNGNLNGLGGADIICNNAASSASLTGTFTALLSSASVDAKSRITVSGDIYNTHGEVLANNATDLWDGTIDNKVGYDEKGIWLGNVDVWTGTLPGGTKSVDTCTSWTSSANGNGVNGRIGEADEKGSDWVSDASAQCNQSKHIYCFR